MNSPNDPSPRNTLPRSFYQWSLAPDDDVLAAMLSDLAWDDSMHARVDTLARDIVATIRAEGETLSWLDALLHEYELTTQEGTALMCLAEAILRIPDRATADALIADKIAQADWKSHLRDAQTSLFVNAGTWGLLLSGKLLRAEEQTERSLTAALQRVLSKGGEPIVRQAIGASVRMLGRKFIVGRSIENALDRSRELAERGYRLSYDMLGEGARTMRDAEKYFASYARALEAVGRAAQNRGPIASPGISVKLSALHPRYEWAQRERVHAELTPKLIELGELAKRHDIGMTIDAEEADRLELSLEILARLCAEPLLAGWEGLGLAVQAYQKRGVEVVRRAIDLARDAKRRLMVRLVKGAYWDSEIKRAQERGLAGYPVFTRKPATDVSYLACAKEMLAADDVIYSQFATHNAYSVAAVLTLAGDRAFEFQKLYGMGDALHAHVYRRTEGRVPTRIYAPVGGYQELLPYLVRRLLENGANSSFVNQLSDPSVDVARLVADPVREIEAARPMANPRIALPRDLYGSARRNASAFDLSNPPDLARIVDGQDESDATDWQAGPIVDGVLLGGDRQPVTNPARRKQVVGEVAEADASHVEQALASAWRAWPRWNATPADARAAALERAADLLEARMPLIMGLVTREAGKTIPDAQAEVREAVDFCRYYALQAREKFSAPLSLPGPTGERNSLQLEGRGVFLCVSPWNFPLAIFMGQVTAALAAGNAVIAKPAEQTPLIAATAVRILHEAGVPPEALHLLPGRGEVVGAALTRDPRIAGIAFTGGTDTARIIARTLAERPGPIIPFIAETGGLNAMIVDSSALPEQVTGDVLLSAFGSAGQRCSALRLLLLQDNVAQHIVDMIAGAMQELRLGDPAKLETDVGPVIDGEALATLRDHSLTLRSCAKQIAFVQATPECSEGSFFTPCAFELRDPTQLTREVFGPVLHIARYRERDLEAVVDAVNATGYGLTFGMHSRIDSRIAQVAERIRAGNVYVNRGMTGAIVGVQPFGGEGLSGTGPKAGGPHYLLRFATEKTISINTTAAGGNATLLSMS
jgi:RHH-type proline utilization regulon transcriptional repressor/proline dehydrogenase/delta 1-pyrroline-5-carboxylate dehydrogenase